MANNNIKITSNTTDELLPLSEFQQFVIDEFIDYKLLSLTSSLGNFVTPNEVYQESNPSFHCLFGRDRLFISPHKWKINIDYENLSHVHFDKEELWSNVNPQWYCTSQYSLVYSAFSMSDVHFHFVIHDLLLNIEAKDNFDAHNSYTEDDIKYYLDNAEYYRRIKIKK